MGFQCLIHNNNLKKPLIFHELPANGMSTTFPVGPLYRDSSNLWHILPVSFTFKNKVTSIVIIMKLS